MSTFAVVKTGGKQYLAQEGAELVVDHVEGDVGSKVELTVLATFSEDGKISLGTPVLEKKAIAEVVESGKGTKVRVAKFKAKVRYRKVMGFRPTLTKLKILSV